MWCWWIWDHTFKNILSSWLWVIFWKHKQVLDIPLKNSLMVSHCHPGSGCNSLHGTSGPIRNWPFLISLAWFSAPAPCLLHFSHSELGSMVLSLLCDCYSLPGTLWPSPQSTPGSLTRSLFPLESPAALSWLRKGPTSVFPVLCLRPARSIYHCVLCSLFTGLCPPPERGLLMHESCTHLVSREFG